MEGTCWTTHVVLGSLMFYLVWLTLSESRHGLPSPLRSPDLAERGPTSGEVCCLSAHHHSDWVTGGCRGGGQATPMNASCPTQRSKGTRQCQLHPGLLQSQGARLHPPTETNCPAYASALGPLSQAREKQCETQELPPSLGTGKPLKEARKDHGSAWT